MERDKISKDIKIPSVIAEVEIYKIGNKHYLSMMVEKKLIRLCIEDLKVSSLTELLICK